MCGVLVREAVKEIRAEIFDTGATGKCWAERDEEVAESLEHGKS